MGFNLCNGFFTDIFRMNTKKNCIYINIYVFLLNTSNNFPPVDFKCLNEYKKIQLVKTGL